MLKCGYFLLKAIVLAIDETQDQIVELGLYWFLIGLFIGGNSYFLEKHLF